MGKSINILFLADFHYTAKNILNKSKYINSFYESVSDHEDMNIDILIIAGDICDKGGCEEDYENAVSLINDIMDKLSIEKAIIVPGNHDVSRDTLLGLRGKKGYDENKLWEYTEKYDYFKKISDVKNFTLNLNSAIVSQELIKDRYLFMGINSNFKIGIEDGIGYVDIEKLEKELEGIKKSYGQKYMNMTKIVVMHHFPRQYISHLEKASNNNKTGPKTIGNFDLDNWTELKKLFNIFDVSIVLTGHVHGSQVNVSSDCDEGENEIYYSSIGSIGVNFNSELSDILKFVNENQMTNAQQEKYKEFINWFESDDVMLSISNRHNTYGIIMVSEDKIEEQHYIYLADEGVTKWVPWYKPKKSKRLLNNSSSSSTSPFETDNVKVKQKKKEDVEKCIMNIVREEHLYKTGHFHWKDQCVMNWIDTSILLTNSRYLKMISDYIVNRFSEILDNAQYIVGLGMKGAILMTSFRYKYPEKKYTYYPENDENFNEFEKCVLNNEMMDRIVVLTDVVHSGGTIKSFVEKNQNYIVDNSKVEVIAIFFTEDSVGIESVVKAGNKQQTIEININELLKIPVRNCGKNSSNCNVIKEKLDIVYEM